MQSKISGCAINLRLYTLPLDSTQCFHLICFFADDNDMRKKKDQFDPYLLFQFRFSVCIKLVHTPMRLQNFRYRVRLAGLHTTNRPMYDRILVSLTGSLSSMEPISFRIFKHTLQGKKA